MPSQNTVTLPDLYEASISELQSGLSQGHFTSVQLTQAYLSRIQEVNSKLHCVLATNPHALEAAAQADKERSSNSDTSSKPLLGIPISVKDNMSTRSSDGMPTTASSLALKGAMAKEDSDVVNALKEAGAIILAKLSLSEWAYFRAPFELPSGWGGMQGQMLSAYGENANPLGSSGGSGVATSIGLCAGSLGSETFGSIVFPASWNNLVGVRPTIGLVSGKGVTEIPISSNHDSVGPMTRCVEDAALILEALTHSKDYLKVLDKNALQGKRLGQVKQFKAPFYEETGTPKYLQAIYDEAVKVLQGLGAEIVEVDIPEWEDLSEFGDGPKRIMNEDFKAELEIYLKTLERNPNNIHTMQDLIDFNLAHKETEMPAGYESQSSLEACAAALDRDIDPEYKPTLEEYSTNAQKVLTDAMKTHNLDAFIFNGPADMPFSKAHWPQVIVPMGFTGEDTPIIKDFNHATNELFPIDTWTEYPGRPVGLAFSAEAFSEAKLISFAYAFEQATHHRLRRKALPQYTPSTQL